MEQAYCSINRSGKAAGGSALIIGGRPVVALSICHEIIYD
jgi:hypothetical protein